MEAAFVNTVGPDDAVVVGVNGLFGERMCDVAGRSGAEVVRVDAPWGDPLDPAVLLGAHPAPKVIALVHAETSTGVRNDVAAVGAGKGDALLLADCVTSLGGIPVDIDGWGVDVAYSGTQKCLGVSPGWLLSPWDRGPGAADRADRKLVPRPRHDRRTYTSGATRKYHHTAPVAMITSLHAGLGALLDEGFPAAWERHTECGRMLQDGLEKMGLELWAAEGHRLPQLTTVRVPDRRRRRLPCRDACCRRYGIEIGGGVGPWPGRSGASAAWATRRGRATSRCSGSPGGDSRSVSAPWPCAAGADGPPRPAAPPGRERLRGLAGSTDPCADWLLKWEPRPLPGQPDATADRPCFAARCGVRERERQLGNGYGFGIFVGRALRRGDQPVFGAAGPVPERLRRLLDRRGRGRTRLRPRGVRGALPVRLRGPGAAPVAGVDHSAQRPSRRVAEKLGLREEGIALRYLEIDGVWEDHVRYAITSEDWADREPDLVAAWLES